MHSWNIAIGNFFFRYRNALFPLIIAFGFLLLRPQPMFGNMFDWILGAMGVVFAVLGEAIRLATIGFQYIHRGGKDGKVYAKRLVRGGMYGITRNPMYLGNGLICVGMIMYLGSPAGYFTLIPFFLFVYHAIIAAEESYLQKQFGSDYDAYAATVNRIIPSFSSVRESFARMRFDWRRSIKKDLGTIAGLTIGLNVVPVWRSYFLHHAAATHRAGLRAFWLILAISLVYFILLKLKHANRLFRAANWHKSR